jgi:hypothetical protein
VLIANLLCRVPNPQACLQQARYALDNSSLMM